MRSAGLALLLLILPACAAQPAASSAPGASLASLTPSSSAPSINLVDPQKPLAVAGDTGWEYQRTATADFDGDGVNEQAVLIAQVGLYNGRVAWEDGHVWQLYIEEPDGARSYVYAQFLPFGLLEASLVSGSTDGQTKLILVERTPQTIGVYEVTYAGPRQLRSVELVWRELSPSNGFSGTPN